MEERGVQVDHATLNRWVINYSPLISAEAKKRKRTVATSWRMDETYIKVKGKWVYLYRAVDKFGDTIDFMVSEHRDEADEAVATAFFKQAIDANGFPSKVVMDKSGANYAGLENINMLLMACLKNAVAAISSRCSDSMKSMVSPNLSTARYK